MGGLGGGLLGGWKITKRRHLGKEEYLLNRVNRILMKADQSDKISSGV